MNNIPLGIYGEDLAAVYLKKSGYKIIERNFRIRGGEIDIIAFDKSTLVFVEVKTRTSHRFGSPAESITKSKLKFIERASKFYCAKRRLNPNMQRIDFVSVDLTDGKSKIELIKNISF